MPKSEVKKQLKFTLIVQENEEEYSLKLINGENKSIMGSGCNTKGTRTFNDAALAFCKMFPDVISREFHNMTKTT